MPRLGLLRVCGALALVGLAGGSSAAKVRDLADSQSASGDLPNLGTRSLPPASAVEKLSAVHEKLSALRAEESKLKTALAGIEPGLTLNKKRAHARARAYVRLIRTGFLPAGGGFDALVDHAARAERLRRSLERDISAEKELARQSGELTRELERVQASRGPLEVQAEALESARGAMAEADERHAAFSRAFERGTADSITIYGAEPTPGSGLEPESTSGFAALKGQLPFPVAGRTEVKRVWKRSAGGPGLELRAGKNGYVRSVGAGRVAFADEYSDYGLTIIVDHGTHYYSVYAGLGAADVKTGDAVASGVRLGTAGSDGMVYFEMRRGADTVDPSPWLGL